MDGWVLWLIAAAILAFGEIHTQGFFLLPFSGGALAAALINGFGGSPVFEWAAFVVVSLAMLAILRPIAKSRRMPPHLRTGTNALVGRSGMVVERISNPEAVGCVRIEGGEVWTARALEEDGEIEAGRKVRVVEIRGATALVTE